MTMSAPGNDRQSRCAARAPLAETSGNVDRVSMHAVPAPGGPAKDGRPAGCIPRATPSEGGTGREAVDSPYCGVDSPGGINLFAMPRANALPPRLRSVPLALPSSASGCATAVADGGTRTDEPAQPLDWRNHELQQLRLTVVAQQEELHQKDAEIVRQVVEIEECQAQLNCLRTSADENAVRSLSQVEELRRQHVMANVGQRKTVSQVVLLEDTLAKASNLLKMRMAEMSGEMLAMRHAAEERIESLEISLDELSGQSVVVVEELQHVTRERDLLQKSLCRCELSLQNMTLESNDLRSQRDQAIKDHEACREALLRSEESREGILRQFADLELLVDTLQSSSASLRDEKTAQEAEIEELRQELEVAKNQRKYVNTDAEVEFLEETLDATSKQLDMCQEQLRNVQEEQSQLKEFVATMQTECAYEVAMSFSKSIDARHSQNMSILTKADQRVVHDTVQNTTTPEVRPGHDECKNSDEVKAPGTPQLTSNAHVDHARIYEELLTQMQLGIHSVSPQRRVQCLTPVALRLAPLPSPSSASPFPRSLSTPEANFNNDLGDKASTGADVTTTHSCICGMNEVLESVGQARQEMQNLNHAVGALVFDIIDVLMVLSRNKDADAAGEDKNGVLPVLSHLLARVLQTIDSQYTILQSLLAHSTNTKLEPIMKLLLGPDGELIVSCRVASSQRTVCVDRDGDVFDAGTADVDNLCSNVAHAAIARSSIPSPSLTLAKQDDDDPPVPRLCPSPSGRRLNRCNSSLCAETSDCNPALIFGPPPPGLRFGG